MGVGNCYIIAKRAHYRIMAGPHREVDFDRREHQLVGAGHELEAAVALDQPGEVRKPARVDVEVLVDLFGLFGRQRVVRDPRPKTESIAMKIDKLGMFLETSEWSVKRCRTASGRVIVASTQWAVNENKSVGCWGGAAGGDCWRRDARRRAILHAPYTEPSVRSVSHAAPNAAKLWRTSGTSEHGQQLFVVAQNVHDAR